MSLNCLHFWYHNQNIILWKMESFILKYLYCLWEFLFFLNLGFHFKKIVNSSFDFNFVFHFFSLKNWQKIFWLAFLHYFIFLLQVHYYYNQEFLKYFLLKLFNSPTGINYQLNYCLLFNFSTILVKMHCRYYIILKPFFQHFFILDLQQNILLKTILIFLKKS